MFRKYASAEIIAHSGQHVGRTAGKKTLGSFDYEPRDDHKYLYVAVRACTADVPNLNYDMLPSSELKGKEAYKTFIGSYVYLNHDNTDPLKARGAIIDAKYHDEDPDDQWVEILEELDEEKCPKLCALIRSGEIDTVSMGCEVTSTTCSICGNEAEYPFEYCEHIKSKWQKYAGKLAYEICNGIDFFECSWVYNPADPTAYVQALDKTASMKQSYPDASLNDIIYNMMPDFEKLVGNGERESSAALSCAAKAQSKYSLSSDQFEGVRRGLLSAYYGITRFAKRSASSMNKKMKLADDRYLHDMLFGRCESFLCSFVEYDKFAPTKRELEEFAQEHGLFLAFCDDGIAIDDDYIYVEEIIGEEAMEDWRYYFSDEVTAFEKDAVQTTFVPHWDQDYATVEYTVYQCDDLENCDWVFFDYDFAMSHGFDFDKYRRIYHGHYDLRGPSSIPDWSDKQFLELLYTEWNTGEAPKDAWNMRSLSMSDIVYLYGRYYYCDRIGWKEIDPFAKGEKTASGWGHGSLSEWFEIDGGLMLLIDVAYDGKWCYEVYGPDRDPNNSAWPEPFNAPNYIVLKDSGYGYDSRDDAVEAFCIHSMYSSDMMPTVMSSVCLGSKHAAADDEKEEKEDSYANTPRKPDDIATKEEQTICPLCDSPSFDGEYCDICGYQVPPEGFDDIKLETDSDYEEYESEAESENDVDDADETEDEEFDFGYEDEEDDSESEDEDIEETESEDEDEQFDFGYEEEDIDETDDEDSDSDDEEEEDKDKKKKNAAALFDISDDPQTFIGMAEYGGDYQLIGFDIISTRDEWLQDELRMAGAKRID